jgi:acetyl esterase
MPLHPQVEKLLAAQAGAQPLHELDVGQARRVHAEAASVQNGPPTPVAGVEDLAAPGPAGAVPVRVYTPEAAAPGSGQAPPPVVVWFHGGGWVVGTLDTYDPLCRALAAASGAVVASVDYRLAPEHRFPAAVEDCWAATRWVAAHAGEVGGSPDRIAVAGDSAGGNLATVVARRARDAGGPRLAFQLLVYPATDAAMDTASYQDLADGYYLTAPLMRWYWGHYLGDDRAGADPDASPLQAPDLAGLPPALVVTAEYDPLRDEGEAYAARLAEAGVPTVVRRHDGMVHGFFRWRGVLDAAAPAMAEAAAALRAALRA